MRQVEALEEQLQTVKWNLATPSSKARTSTASGSSIIVHTVAILTKQFPPGTTYERQIRRDWNRRLRHAG